MNENYSQTELERQLAPRPVRFYASCESTNDLALAWLREGAPAGGLVIADEQTRGRGRTVDGVTRTWHTPPGVAIALSMILRPAPEHLHRVMMAGAVAVYSTLTALSIQDVNIKWANDVLIGRRKVAGVLPEAIWDGDQLIGAILGIGINIRNEFTDTDLEQTATTVERSGIGQVDRGVFIQSLCAHFPDLASPEIFSRYQAALSTLGKRVTINTIDGIAEDVDHDGALLVRDDAGTLHRIVAGDVL